MNTMTKKYIQYLAKEAADALFKLGDDPGHPCNRIEFKGIKNAGGVERSQGGLRKSALVMEIAKSLKSSLT